VYEVDCLTLSEAGAELYKGYILRFAFQSRYKYLPRLGILSGFITVPPTRKRRRPRLRINQSRVHVPAIPIAYSLVRELIVSKGM
jgi:hypothetical protein